MYVGHITYISIGALLMALGYASTTPKKVFFSFWRTDLILTNDQCKNDQILLKRTYTWNAADLQTILVQR